MPMTINELQTPKSKTDIRADLLKQLGGVGFTQRAGFSPGNVVVTGVPVGDYSLIVEIVGAGNLGVATRRVSTDGGLTWGTTVVVPGGGSEALAGTGLTITYVPSGTTAFLAGERYTVATSSTPLPATSWQAFSLPLTLVENDAAALEELYALVPYLAASGFVQLAEDEWLRLHASGFYGLDWFPGLTTRGTCRLVDAANTGPHNIVAGQTWFVSAGGLRYSAVANQTLTLGGTLDVTVQAEQPGQAYNVANGTITSLVTTLAGVTVTNPDLGNGTWISTAGADAETDASLARRCLARWPGIGSPGAVESVYLLWATQAAGSAITRVVATPSLTQEGQVNVTLVGPGGPVSAPTVTTVGNYIAPRVPLPVTVSVASAVALPVTVAASISVKTSQRAQAIIDVNKNLNALFLGGTNSIGEVLPGITTVVRVNEIIEQIMLVQGVVDCVLTTPASNIALTSTQVATLTAALTFVLV